MLRKKLQQKKKEVQHKTAAVPLFSRPICSHCQKWGHDITACYQLHGYLEWWIEKKRQIATGINFARGRGGGRTGAGRGRGRNRGSLLSILGQEFFNIFNPFQMGKWPMIWVELQLPSLTTVAGRRLSNAILRAVKISSKSFEYSHQF